MKTCTKCGKSLPKSQFHKKSRAYDGLRPECKDCRPADNTAAYRKRKSWIKTRYNITIDDFNRMYTEQDGKCAICKKHLAVKSTHIDHDHKTGQVRGILCRACNHGLGNYCDNIQYLKNAIKYLRDANETNDN